MAEFPTYEKMAKDVAEKALDEFLYQGKSIREWMKIITEQDDLISRQAVLEELYELKDIPKLNTGYVMDAIRKIRNLPSVNPHEPKTNKIKAEIDKQEKWLFKAGYTIYNVDIAFSAIKSALAESEDTE